MRKQLTERETLKRSRASRKGGLARKKQLGNQTGLDLKKTRS